MTATEVLDDLYVGDMRDGENEGRLERNDITHVVNLGQKASATFMDPRQNERYVHFQMRDGQDDAHYVEMILETAARMYENAKRDDGKLLVHCDVGSSRSVVVAAALMSFDNGEDVHSNVEKIKTVRTAANPLPELEDQVARLTRAMVAG
jgi:predicted protein tyrosine phosphatase